MTICYYHITWEFQSESTLYSCLDFKEILAQNRCHIWSLSDSNKIRTHNDLVRKQIFNHLTKLAKWFSCVVSTYHLTLCYYYATYEFQSKSTLYSCSNLQELIYWNRRHNWSWLNGWVSINELSIFGLESHWCHLKFRCGACYE